MTDQQILKDFRKLYIEILSPIYGKELVYDPRIEQFLLSSLAKVRKEEREKIEGNYIQTATNPEEVKATREGSSEWGSAANTQPEEKKCKCHCHFVEKPHTLSDCIIGTCSHCSQTEEKRCKFPSYMNHTCGDSSDSHCSQEGESK